MKKYVTYILLIMFLFLSFTNNIQASNYDINISADKTAVNALEDYHVYITYNGLNKLSSLSFNVVLKNTSCTISTPGCNGLHCALNTVNPNARIVNMVCNNSDAGIADISISGINAKNNNGGSVSLKSKYISISTKTTATEVTTTPSSQSIVTSKQTNTTSRRSRTKKTSKKTTTIITTQPTTEEIITAHLEVISTTKNVNNLRLKKMSIVNYDIDFKENKKEYTITVPEDLEYLEIVALPVSSDIALNNVGKVDIIDKDKIVVELSKDNVKANYIINIERKEKKKGISFITIFLIVGMIVGGTVAWLIINNIKSKKHESVEELNKKNQENEDAKKLLEEELEITQTFYNLNKRL